MFSSTAGTSKLGPFRDSGANITRLHTVRLAFKVNTFPAVRILLYFDLMYFCTLALICNILLRSNIKYLMCV